MCQTLGFQVCMHGPWAPHYSVNNIWSPSCGWTHWLKYIEYWDQVSLGIQIGEAEVGSSVFPAKPCVSPFPHIWPLFSWWPAYLQMFLLIPLPWKGRCMCPETQGPTCSCFSTPDEISFRVSFWDYRRLVFKRNPLWCHFKRRSQIRQTQVWLLVLPCSSCGSCTILKCTLPSLLFPPSLFPPLPPLPLPFSTLTPFSIPSSLPSSPSLSVSNSFESHIFHM